MSGTGRPRTSVVTISRVERAIVVAVHGALDGPTNGQLRHALVDLIDGQGNLDVVIDLRHAEIVDLAVAELIADAHDLLHRKGGCLGVEGLPAPLRPLLPTAADANLAGPERPE